MTWELALRGSSHGLGKVQTQSWGHDGLVLVVAWHTLETQGWRGSRAKEPVGKGLDLLLCEQGVHWDSLAEPVRSVKSQVAEG